MPATFSPAMADRIEVWPVERLKPYANNARTHSPEQVTKIAASITEFGFTNPILVDSSDGIIAGHGRLMAAQKLGMREVPVILLDHLTDAQRRAYILADNRLALDAGWDDGMLSQELAALNADGFDLGLTGFNDEELDPKYVDVIVRRWQEFTGKQATLEETGQTFADVAAGRGVPLPANDNKQQADDAA